MITSTVIEVGAQTLMRRYDIPAAPVLVGMILGPLSEQQFRRALAISQRDMSIFVTQPIAATVLAPTEPVVKTDHLTVHETLEKLPTCPNSQIDSLLPLRAQALHHCSQ